MCLPNGASYRTGLGFSEGCLMWKKTGGLTTRALLGLFLCVFLAGNPSTCLRSFLVCHVWCVDSVLRGAQHMSASSLRNSDFLVGCEGFFLVRS